MSLVRLSAREAMDRWHQLKPFIRAAIERSLQTVDAEDILSGIAHGTLMVWVLDSPFGIAVTEIVNHPKRRSCCIRIVAGTDLEAILKHENEIETWAKSRGCTALELDGRWGWIRALPHWTLRKVTMDREI